MVKLDTDVIIVGGGPAGLSAALRLAALQQQFDRAPLSIAVLEKARENGAHLLSGAVLDPSALDELIPDWKERGAPLDVPVTDDQIYFLTQKRKLRFPITPPPLRNHGNYVVSLGNVCRWLGEQAETFGVEVYPGFAAAEILYREDGSVKGVATGDMGRTRDGEEGPNFERGMELHARQTLFAEGCHGSLTKTLFKRFGLTDGVDPQVYGLGIKELWEIEPNKHVPGQITHTSGWPMSSPRARKSSGSVRASPRLTIRYSASTMP